MARELRVFPVVVAAGTPIATPVTTQIRFPPRVVDEITFQIPPGPRGEVGFRLGSSGTQIFPFDAGTWMVTDNEEITFSVDGAHDSGSWELTAYNTGQFPHTITVRFYLDLVQKQQSALAAPLTADQLGAVPQALDLSQLQDLTVPELLPPPPLPPLPTVPAPAVLPPPPLIPLPSPLSPDALGSPAPPAGGYDVLSPGLKVGLAHTAFWSVYQRGPSTKELFDFANTLNADGSNYGDLVQGLTANINNPDELRLQNVTLAGRIDTLAGQ